MQKNSRTRKRRYTMMAISGVVSMLFAVLLYSGHIQQKRIVENEARKQMLSEQIAEENARTEEIYELEEYMQTEEYIKSVAQSKIGLVHENEIIFKPVR